MTVLSGAKEDRGRIARAFGDPSCVVVVSFCAAWCDTCGEFRAAYERIAQARPRIAFVWLDIEDDADIAGDIDVENFPTLAVYRGDMPLHFGVSSPQEQAVARLVDALERALPFSDAPVAVRELPGAFGSSEDYPSDD